VFFIEKRHVVTW